MDPTLYLYLPKATIPASEMTSRTISHVYRSRFGQHQLSRAAHQTTPDCVDFSFQFPTEAEAFHLMAVLAGHASQGAAYLHSELLDLFGFVSQPGISAGLFRCGPGLLLSLELPGPALLQLLNGRCMPGLCSLYISIDQIASLMSCSDSRRLVSEYLIMKRR